MNNIKDSLRNRLEDGSNSACILHCVLHYRFVDFWRDVSQRKRSSFSDDLSDHCDGEKRPACSEEHHLIKSLNATEEVSQQKRHFLFNGDILPDKRMNKGLHERTEDKLAHTSHHRRPSSTYFEQVKMVGRRE
ncbi:hypothetical protein TNCV_2685881 [Trichonephila clavipes]|nr:hypothetical protein TNCV_2685881 [Trichonephila clavipes]